VRDALATVACAIFGIIGFVLQRNENPAVARWANTIWLAAYVAGRI
jgi:hypothetical protein